MTDVESSSMLLDRVVLTEAQPERRPTQLTTGERQVARGGAQWHHALQRLRGWLEDPSMLDRDESEPPEMAVIRAAIWLLHVFRDQELPEDFFPAPDGKGGVCFERRSAPLFEEYEIEKSGRVSHRRYIEGRLVQRAVLGWIPTLAEKGHA